MSLFIKLIIDNDLYYEITNFLDLMSIKNLMLLNKETYFSTKNRKITRKIVNKRVYDIFYHLFKKYLVYVKIINQDNIDLSRIMAINFFKNSPKRYINLYFTSDTYVCDIKKEIIQKYNHHMNKENYTRLDLFYLIKSMTIEDSIYLGM